MTKGIAMKTNNENSHNYDDIINLPHYTSKKRPRMSMHDRAAQFSPFAALTGYEDAVEETARLTDSKIELDDDKAADINAKLQLIKEHLSKQPEVTVTYFVPDEKKSGGAYLTFTDRVRIIDEYEKSIVFISGKRIAINNIYSIEGEMFKNVDDKLE